GGLRGGENECAIRHRLRCPQVLRVDRRGIGRTPRGGHDASALGELRRLRPHRQSNRRRWVRLCDEHLCRPALCGYCEVRPEVRGHCWLLDVEYPQCIPLLINGQVSVRDPVVRRMLYTLACTGT